MWPAQADLHAMVHFDLALHTIPSVFDATPASSDAHLECPAPSPPQGAWQLQTPVARQALERPATASVFEPVAAKVARARLPLTIPFLVQVDPEYLGSLMILVALVLGLGFSILILLALFLCLIITCMQPVNRPSNAMRLAVISASCCLAISAGMSVTSNRRFASGLDQLLNSTTQLHTLTSQARAMPLSGATKALWPQLSAAGMSALQSAPSLCAGG
tara:strand:- start:1179 stop:1832 length:654 start_codon:yes stop_codon:yes gene_type:complete